MIDGLFGIAIGALLFALYGLVRIKRCAGHCTGCSDSCDRLERHAHHD